MATIPMRLDSKEAPEKINNTFKEIESNGIMETARELNITIIAYSPLAQGLVSGKFHKDRELIQKRVGSRKHMNKFKKEGLIN